MNIWIVVLSVIGVIVLCFWAFAFGAIYTKRGMVDPTTQANTAIDTLLHCLSHDKDYKGFKTRTDIIRWIESRRKNVQEAMNRE